MNILNKFTLIVMLAPGNFISLDAVSSQEKEVCANEGGSSQEKNILFLCADKNEKKSAYVAVKKKELPSKTFNTFNQICLCVLGTVSGLIAIGLTVGGISLALREDIPIGFFSNSSVACRMLVPQKISIGAGNRAFFLIGGVLGGLYSGLCSYEKFMKLQKITRSANRAKIFIEVKGK
jgi:hypothetical protein